MVAQLLYLQKTRTWGNDKYIRNFFKKAYRIHPLETTVYWHGKNHQKWRGFSGLGFSGLGFSAARTIAAELAGWMSTRTTLGELGLKLGSAQLQNLVFPEPSRPHSLTFKSTEKL